MFGDDGGYFRENCFLAPNEVLRRYCFAKYNRPAEEDEWLENAVYLVATGGSGFVARQISKRAAAGVTRVVGKYFGRDVADSIDPRDVDNRRLRNIIGNLFPDRYKRPGGTAGELRRELSRGDVRPQHHLKVLQSARAIEKVLKTGKLSAEERTVARALLNDLRDVLNDAKRRGYTTPRLRR